jgi:hypothetical protein
MLTTCNVIILYSIQSFIGTKLALSKESLVYIVHAKSECRGVVCAKDYDPYVVVSSLTQPFTSSEKLDGSFVAQEHKTMNVYIYLLKRLSGVRVYTTVTLMNANIASIFCKLCRTRILSVYKHRSQLSAKLVTSPNVERRQRR